ncbi:MAG: hypothetical protein K0R54_1845 [Clostridiaceae bacterium]|jgi:maltodextrin utilization protein YvdJ|nr:hypothetical protein [Clostridiaceae bacterium]
MGINFHNTGMGKKYFSVHIPSIAKSLEIIAIKLNDNENSNSMRHLADIRSLMSSFLKAMYDGSNQSISFFQTNAGSRFYNGTMSKIAKTLEEIAKDDRHSSTEVFQLIFDSKTILKDYSMSICSGETQEITLSLKKDDEFFRFKTIEELESFIKNLKE